MLKRVDKSRFLRETAKSWRERFEDREEEEEKEGKARIGDEGKEEQIRQDKAKPSPGWRRRVVSLRCADEACGLPFVDENE